eukprot:766456-Hanusia_phi.AAC.3
MREETTGAAGKRPATANILFSSSQHKQKIGIRKASGDPVTLPSAAGLKLNLVSLFSDYDKQQAEKVLAATPHTARSARSRQPRYHPLVTTRGEAPRLLQEAEEVRPQSLASQQQQASFIRRERVLHRVQVREFRDQLFSQSPRKFSSQDVDNLCKLLLGTHERNDVQRSSLKSPEERSYGDCEPLCKLAQSSKHLVEAFDESKLANLFRSAQVIHLNHEESLSKKFNDEGLVLLIRGKLIEQDEEDRKKVFSSLTKGDVLVCMPEQSHTSSLLKDTFRRSLRAKMKVGGALDAEEGLSGPGIQEDHIRKYDLKRNLEKLDSQKFNFSHFSELSGLCFTKNIGRFVAVDTCDAVLLSLQRFQDFAMEFSQDVKETMWVCDVEAWRGQVGDWRRMVFEVRQGNLLLRAPATTLEQKHNLAESEIIEGLPDDSALKYMESAEVVLDRDAFFGMRLVHVRTDGSLASRRLLFVASSKEDRERISEIVRYYMTVHHVIRRSNLERLEISGTSRCKARDKENSQAQNTCFQRLLQAHELLLSNRVAEFASFLSSLKLFRSWAWKDVFAMSQSARAISVPKGSFVFHQSEQVKGLYVLRLGFVSIVRYKALKETSLRFPGRDDLFMEEALELQVRGVEKKIVLGKSGDESVFGEELVNGKHSRHNFSLEAENRAVLICIPWEVPSPSACKFLHPMQAIQKVLEEKKKQFQTFLDTLLKNLSKRSEPAQSTCHE